MKKEILAGVLVVLAVCGVVGFFVFMPWIFLGAGQVWSAAEKWNCEKYGGSAIATTSYLTSNPYYRCELP